MMTAAITLFNLKAMFKLLAAKKQLKHKGCTPKVLEHRPIGFDSIIKRGLEDVFQPITQAFLVIQGFT